MGREEIRDKAFLDYKKGLKYKEIADKYGVSLSTIKSWAARYWKREGCNQEEKLQPEELQPERKKLQPEASQPKKTTTARGAPKGNRNAAGNKGGSAPEKNKNALKHGAYSKVYWDALDEEELDLIAGMEDAEEQQLIMQLQMFSVRERRLMRNIRKYRELEEKKGMAVKSVSKTKKVEDLADDGGEGPVSGNCKKVTQTSVTQTEAVLNSILALEAELTRVQKAKTRAIEALAKIRTESLALAEEDTGSAIVDDWIKAVTGGGEGGKK